ncbi:hypothetical protein HYU16_01080 [Candidatus Woesearchaeota archaeon]|nr:hypothetical protein [Candidatus Woesearchaeota archaeon]
MLGLRKGRTDNAFLDAYQSHRYLVPTRLARTAWTISNQLQQEFPDNFLALTLFGSQTTGARIYRDMLGIQSVSDVDFGFIGMDLGRVLKQMSDVTAYLFAEHGWYPCPKIRGYINGEYLGGFPPLEEAVNRIPRYPRLQQQFGFDGEEYSCWGPPPDSPPNLDMAMLRSYVSNRDINALAMPFGCTFGKNKPLLQMAVMLAVDMEIFAFPWLVAGQEYTINTAISSENKRTMVIDLDYELSKPRPGIPIGKHQRIRAASMEKMTRFMLPAWDEHRARLVKALRKGNPSTAFDWLVDVLDRNYRLRRGNEIVTSAVLANPETPSQIRTYFEKQQRTMDFETTMSILTDKPLRDLEAALFDGSPNPGGYEFYNPSPIVIALDEFNGPVPGAD